MKALYPARVYASLSSMLPFTAFLCLLLMFAMPISRYQLWKNHYIICGEEFGLENKGKRAIIVRALYGGKADGRDFWHHLRSCMMHLGFKSKGGDPDVWMRPMTRADGTKLYEYVLLYTYDCLVVSDNVEYILKREIGRYFELKPASIGPPNLYLGGHLHEVDIDEATTAWAFSST